MSKIAYTLKELLLIRDALNALLEKCENDLKDNNNNIYYLDRVVQIKKLIEKFEKALFN